MVNIKFGTDGWRAIVGKDFNEDNVTIVANAIGKYVYESFGIKKKFIIGYDPRNMAFEFATLTAKILASIGFDVMLSSRIVPTPVLAFGAKYFNACAVMFTASHNPPEYLGMKFIPDYAGPATSKITDSIVANLGKNIVKTPAMPIQGRIEKFDFFTPYYEHLKSIIDFDKIKQIKEKIIYDGLYSASIGYFDKILDDNDINYEALHMEHDINFGGGMPDPKPQYLTELISKIKNAGENLTVGLSNDGDGDRFGLVNENGEYVSPNEIIAILLLYLRNSKKLQGPLVKTVSGSLMLDKFADKMGIEVIETAVGFKNVGEAMRNYNAIIGGEESGGLSVQGHIPEKDGILADLLILEAMAAKNMSLVDLQKEIYVYAGSHFYNDRIDLKLENQNMVTIAIEKARITKNVCGINVAKTDLKDGVKLYLEDTTSWVLIRPSGTEPLLRIYFETDSEEKLSQLEKFVDAFK